MDCSTADIEVNEGIINYEFSWKEEHLTVLKSTVMLNPIQLSEKRSEFIIQSVRTNSAEWSRGRLHTQGNKMNLYYGSNSFDFQHGIYVNG